MTLGIRKPPYSIPSYSLTGDLLAYLTCGLQYRYHNKGALPPSTPVQLWFGEFIHGVLEEAYLRWKAGGSPPFPWNWQPTVWDIEQTVDRRRLRPKGLVPPPNLFDARGIDQRLASKRTVAAINSWGSQLFPLISEAEVRLRGIRPLTPPSGHARSDYYEVQGVVDVLGSVVLARAPADNAVVSSLGAELGSLERAGADFEVIVDYKGMRRPPISDPTWARFEDQLRTYAWLRRMQPGAKSAAVGVVLFLNELVPSAQDLTDLRDEVRAGTTDIVPGRTDKAKLTSWRGRSGAKQKLPQLSQAYRLARSIRVIPVDDAATTASLMRFDNTVWEIEGGVVNEIGGQSITQAWGQNFLSRHNPPDAKTCTACDFKTFCPIIAKRPGMTVP